MSDIKFAAAAELLQPRSSIISLLLLLFLNLLKVHGEYFQLAFAQVSVLGNYSDLYLQCWTQEKIATEIGVPRETVRDIINSFGENGTHAEMAKIHNFEPKIYNIRNYKEQKADAPVHGTLPQDIVAKHQTE